MSVWGCVCLEWVCVVRGGGGCWGWMCVKSVSLEWIGGGGVLLCVWGGLCVCEMVMLDVGGVVSYVPCKGTVTQVVGVLSTVVKW